LYPTNVKQYNTIRRVRLSFKSRFHAAHDSPSDGVVATNSYFSDTPALDVGIIGHGGTTIVKLFCGRQILFTALYSMWRDGNISGTIEDFIRQYAAPTA
jgi:hypothetical protein